MTATPQYATMIFRGLRSSRTYVKDVYLSDVLNAAVTFDSGAGASATSPDSWLPPEDVTLLDYSQITGTADTTKLQPCRNDIPTGDMLRYLIHLTSLNNRPVLRIGFRSATKVSFLQK